ncbi:cytochrome P450 [Streptomyces sp. BK340]|uniref:cytochrome P450 n=1 Tax=Streptomyces sp. BK340 TaxID=2572903 RepID=UPI00119D8200|nr:cytochrome P450 [Streptomyces sp. BK340]TVZ90352.1 cytochrome P450 [Streptomyces sp. BK340]
MATTPGDQDVFFAQQGSCPFSPAPAHERARSEQPVKRVALADGSYAWMVTRHEDVRAVFGDPRFSAEAHRPGFPFPNAGRNFIAKGEPSFVRLDDPEHARQRRMLTGYFTVRRIETMRPRIQAMIDDFLDRMEAAGPPADLVADFALPLPSLVICEMLGVPYEDHDFFQERSRVLADTSADPEDTHAAWSDLAQYLEELAEIMRHAPDDGIISRLVQRPDLTSGQVASMSRLLLVAGHDTTANMISLATAALLRHPEQLAALRGNPESVDDMVEELLRWLSPVGHAGVARLALEDVNVGGQTIRAGEGVLCMPAVANRDDTVFPQGGELDLRGDAHRHLAFGFGVHQCLGQGLARLEIQLALQTLFRRLPGLRLAAPFEELLFRHNAIVHGLLGLPVTW